MLRKSMGSLCEMKQISEIAHSLQIALHCLNLVVITACLYQLTSVADRKGMEEYFS